MMLGLAIACGMVAGFGALLVVKGAVSAPLRLGDALAVLDRRLPETEEPLPPGLDECPLAVVVDPAARRRGRAPEPLDPVVDTVGAAVDLVEEPGQILSRSLVHGAHEVVGPGMR